MTNGPQKNLTQVFVIVGDEKVGKTSLFNRIHNRDFEEQQRIYEKEEEDRNVTIDDEVYKVRLIDINSREDNEQARELIYPTADCFVLCYDISNRTSYTNILQKWLPDLKLIKSSTNKPLVLVATKTDLRESKQARALINTEEGEVLSRRINACSFIECSAKDNIRVDQISVEAVKASLRCSAREQQESNQSNWTSACCCCFKSETRGFTQADEKVKY